MMFLHGAPLPPETPSGPAGVAVPVLGSILGTLGFGYQQSTGVCGVLSFQALLI